MPEKSPGGTPKWIWWSALAGVVVLVLIFQDTPAFRASSGSAAPLTSAATATAAAADRPDPDAPTCDQATAKLYVQRWIDQGGPIRIGDDGSRAMLYVRRATWNAMGPEMQLATNGIFDCAISGPSGYLREVHVAEGPGQEPFARFRAVGDGQKARRMASVITDTGPPKD